MALITDPDNLSQGTLNNVADLAFTASSGNQTTLTGAATLPALADNEWFEIRSANTPGNDGLYRVNDASPTTSSVTCNKFTGPNPVNDAASSTDVLGTTGVASEKSVMFDTGGLKVYLLEQGNLSADGVTMLALHSFAKEEWKAADNYLMQRAKFPFVGISFAAGQWVIGQDPSGNNSGWLFADDITAESQRTRKLIRNAGWEEIDVNGNIQQKYFNVTTLPTSGAFEDAADVARYYFGTDNTDTGASVAYTFAGEVNEPVKFFEEVGDLAGDAPTYASTSTITRSTGSFVTDGFVVGCRVSIRGSTSNDGVFVLTGVSATTLTVQGTPLTVEAWGGSVIAWDNANSFTTTLRIRDADPNGKTFGEADLTAAGETLIIAKKIPFGLGNAPDLKITETDANVAANSPYTEVRIRYLAEAYNREVDSAVKRNFGIVIDAGTYSNANGVTNATTLVTSANFTLGVGEALADYTGGTLIIHEGADQGSHTVSGTPVDNVGTLEVTLTAALSGTASSISFTLQRATPLNVDYVDIFEKVQYQLRQASDINETGSTVVVGNTAGRLAVFEGDTLKTGTFLPTNPAGGGSGVMIEGFDTNNTNSLSFTDNGGVARTFPFVSAGNLNFSQNLVDDTDGEYWLFFEYTVRTTNSDIDVVAPSGSTYDLEGTLGTYLVNDYLQISGFAQAANNGLFIVTAVNISGSDYTVRKVDGTNVGTVETNQTVNVDEHPFPSPDAIIVNDNSATPIAGAINATTVAFDFDYDNNIQGGRTAATDAVVRLVAAGLETAQVAVSPTLTIARATGLNFTVTAARERNYSNP